MAQAYVRACRSVAQLRLFPGSAQCDDQLDFYRRVSRQLRYADGTAGMAADIAEHLDEEIRSGVDHFGLQVETWRRGYESGDFKNPFHPIKRSERLIQASQRGCAV